MTEKVVNGNGMLTRSFALKPQTANKEELTVDGVIATENPARMYDWQRGEVDEILIMGGAVYPEKVPTLNAHNRNDVRDVIGVTYNIRIEGPEMVATVKFVDNELGRDTFAKVEQGIITDFSIGYSVSVARYIEKGKKEDVDGRQFEAGKERALKIGKSWQLLENSVVPIGADSSAKVRAAVEPEQAVPVAIEENQAAIQPSTNNAEGKSDMSDEIKAAADAARAEAVTSERARIAAIRDAATGIELADGVVDAAISSGKNADEFRIDCLEAIKAIAAAKPQMPAVIVREDKRHDASTIEAALMVRGGMEAEAVKSYGAPVVDAARRLGSVGMESVMREGLSMAGRHVDRFATVNELIRESLELYQQRDGFSTMSLPYVLGNIANKTALMGYQELAETWQEWVGEISVPDFKTSTMVRGSIGGSLEEVGAGGEIKHGSADEEYESGAAKTFAKTLNISRQQIINDDLNIFTSVPRSMGRDAQMCVGDRVYTQLLANGALSDGAALCGTTHGNLITGTDSVMTTTFAIDALTSAITKFRKMKDKLNRFISVRPEILLVAPECEAAALSVFNSQYLLGVSTAKTPNANIYQGRFRVVCEPRLSDTAITGYSTTAWYLLAPKAQSDSVAVLWLNGVNRPTIERGVPDFNTLGISYRIYLDCGVMSTGYRGIVKSNGA